MKEPISIYTKLAAESIEQYVLKGKTNRNIWNEIPAELQIKAACFVSLHLSDGSLRGCIGTIEPTQDTLYQEIIRNAISAASRDNRFEPLTVDELPNLEISVDVLSIPERIFSFAELDVVKYGIIVSDGNYRRGVLLPNIEGVETIDNQVKIACRKAGIFNMNIENLQLYRFTATRYY